MRNIIVITGFESFNVGLYRQAAQLASSQCQELEVKVFSDRSINEEPDIVQEALSSADVFFASLIFDYNQVIWLSERVKDIPIRLVFESALELMSLTKLGRFAIGDKPKGMPKPIQFILSKFTNSKEEDKLAGYLSFLKIGPKLLKYIPGQKTQDLRNWLIIYGYWNAGGSENFAAMCWTIGEKYLSLDIDKIPAPLETPNLGLLHPEYTGYFTSAKDYLQWYRTKYKPGDTSPVVGLLLYRKHVITKLPYIAELIKYLEQAQITPLPIFLNGVEGHIAVRDLMTTEYEQNQRKKGNREIASLSPDAVAVEAIISTIGFSLVGGPAGSMEAGRQIEVAKRILQAKNVPYIIAAPLLIQDIHSWTRQGIGGLQSVVLYSLPELDGAIDTIIIGGLVGEDIYLIPERVKRLTGRLHSWLNLHHKKTHERKIAIILYNYPPGYGATGTAALLNVPSSLLNFLNALEKDGYYLGDNLPLDGEELIKEVKRADEEISPTRVNIRTLEKWLGYLQSSRIEKQWKSLNSTGLKTQGDDFLIGGVSLGNVWIGVQPPLGIAGDPMRLMFDKDLTPHPQYAAFYNWLQKEFQADAIVHFGMHGTVEWLPGSPLGNTGYSWSDLLLGNLPNLYIYAANNPSESILAKRRGYGVLISYNVPPYGRSGLYKELLNLREIMSEYREDREKNAALREIITQKIIDTGLERDCPFTIAGGMAFTLENSRLFSKSSIDNYFDQVYDYLALVENRLFSCGLHVLGQTPSAESIESYLNAYFDDRLPQKIIHNIANSPDPGSYPQEYQLLISEALQIKTLLQQTNQEMVNLLRGLNGEYIAPAPGGDLLRDGAGVLPTGRNIHSLDPYRMPSAGAYERGRAIARQLLQQHLQEFGEYPQTVAVMLWGLDAIKTRGESLGIILELVGAEPVKEGTGRIVKYELRPIKEVGHPRIDVLVNLSGIFRDTFVNILELLDDMFVRAAQINEDQKDNYIRKHSLSLEQEGVENTTARLFSNPAGDFGSLVNDQVIEGNWTEQAELSDTWQRRNSFSYGRNDKGQQRPEVFNHLLKTSERIIQQIDSVEYGLSDIQEYYANTGGLKLAAEKNSGKKVTASFVESFSQDNTPRKLEDILRLEYRSKLLNPKWAQAMVEQGSGGAYEVSQRMTTLIGWAGTTDFAEDWVYEQAADTYALDPVMSEKLRKANPEAFRNIVGRMLEANGRGFWQADEDKLHQLEELYNQIDEVLEGVNYSNSQSL